MHISHFKDNSSGKKKFAQGSFIENKPGIKRKSINRGKEIKIDKKEIRKDKLKIKG